MTASDPASRPVAVGPVAVPSKSGAAALSIASNSALILLKAIAGTVTGPNGPEAGVWVIAETTDLPTRFAKIAVTDDQGRYVVPDLPKANYNVWVRGYGANGFDESVHVGLDGAPVAGQRGVFVIGATVVSSVSANGASAPRASTAALQTMTIKRR